MPQHRASAPTTPPPVQLPLFPEAVSPVRIRPALNEWRFYRMEVWPDLFGRALLVPNGVASAPKVTAGSIPVRTPATR